MSTETLLLIIILILLVGALPSWSYSRQWGYAPSGFFSIVLVVLLIFVVTSHREVRNSSGDRLQGDLQQVGQDAKDAVHDLTK
jgi:hypothetical protein